MNDFQEGSKAEDMNFPIEEILSGEDFDSLAKSVKRDFDDHERDIPDILSANKDQEVFSESVIEEIDGVVESFAISLEQAFRSRKEIDEGLGEYVKGNLDDLVEVYESLDTNQQNVLKAWMVMDHYRMGKRRQLEQLPDEDIKEIDPVFILDPSIKFKLLVGVYARMLGK